MPRLAIFSLIPRRRRLPSSSSLFGFPGIWAIAMLMLACSPAVPAQDVSVEYFRLEVIDSFPHDPGAFTQGLTFVDGELLESTGLYGRSSLRRVDPYSGTILQQLPLDANYFGEGVAQVGDRLIVLTWKS